MASGRRCSGCCTWSRLMSFLAQVCVSIGQQTLTLAWSREGNMGTPPPTGRIASPFAPPANTKLIARIVTWGGAVSSSQWAQCPAQDHVVESRISDRVGDPCLGGGHGGRRQGRYAARNTPPPGARRCGRGRAGCRAHGVGNRWRHNIR